jgi:hypothetical protein
MSRTTKRTVKAKRTSGPATIVVSEPQAVYARRAARQNKPKRPKQKGYDAKRSSGMIPGLAERMKEYLKTMRDGR